MTTTKEELIRIKNTGVGKDWVEISTLMLHCICDMARDSLDWQTENVRLREAMDKYSEDEMLLMSLERLYKTSMAQTMESEQDSARLRYLTDDHEDRQTRVHRDQLLQRMSVMSYSAACADVDIAIRALKEGK